MRFFLLLFAVLVASLAVQGQDSAPLPYPIPSKSLPIDLGKDSINRAALSPDDSKLLLTGPGGGLLLFDSQTGKQLGRSHEPSFKIGISPVCFSPDGRQIAWLLRGSTIMLFYDTKELKRTREYDFKPHWGGGGFVYIDKNRLLVTGWDSVAAIHDMSTEKRVAIFPKAENPSHCCVSADGRWLLTAGQEILLRGIRSPHFFRMWDIKTQKMVHEFYTTEETIGGVAISPDGKWCACAAGRELRIYNRETGKEAKTARVLIGTGKVSMLFSQDGKTLIAGGHGPRYGMAFWDWQTTKEIRGGVSPEDGDGDDLFENRGIAEILALTSNGRHLYAMGYFAKGKFPGSRVLVFDLDLPRQKEKAKGANAPKAKQAP